MKYALALLVVLAGCGGGGVQPPSPPASYVGNYHVKWNSPAINGTMIIEKNGKADGTVGPYLATGDVTVVGGLTLKVDGTIYVGVLKTSPDGFVADLKPPTHLELLPSGL